MRYKYLLTAALPLALAACVQSTPADVLGSSRPDNPELGIRNANPGDVIGEYNHREPAEPLPWRRSNDRQSPNRKDGS